MVKILFISTSGLKSDGITAWMQQTVIAMDRTGFSFDAVAWEGADPRVIEEIERCGIAVRILPSRQKSVGSYCRGLLRLMRRGGYDVVHVCGSSGLTAVELQLAKSARIPVRICHSHNTSCAHRALDKLLRPLMRDTMTDALACGNGAGRWLFGNRDYSVVPNGRRLSSYRFDPAARRQMRQELGLTDNQVALGHVGRFNEQKNHGKLLSIFSELRERSSRYRLFLVGDGDLREQVEDQVSAKGLAEDVVFLGRRTDIPRLLNAMDCMLLPSLYEGFPNVVVEWQANGLPCVLSDTVSRECALTDLVGFCSLDDSRSGDWVATVEKMLAATDRERDSEDAVCSLRKQGFDIEDSAALQRGIYLDAAKRTLSQREMGERRIV